MFEWLFGRKKGVEEVHQEAKKGFEDVKKDINSLSKWIHHLDSQDDQLKQQVSDVREDLSTIKNDIEGLKNLVSFFDSQLSKQLFKHPRRLLSKHTAVEAVETPVETTVYTAILDNFSSSEKAIVWVLVNSDIKLSYDDLSAMLGKEKSTIRSQINHIKQKSDGLIEELIEKNGKKRVFVPEHMKEMLLKRAKVRVKTNKKLEKFEKIE